MARFVLVLNMMLISQLTYAKGKGNPDGGFRRAIFDYVVDQSAIVQNHKDFERYLLFGLSRSDRQAVMSRLKTQTNYPSFQRWSDSLVLAHDGEKIEIKWPDIRRMTFEINGVKWDYDRSKAFISQYEVLEAKLKSKKVSLVPALEILPKAEATVAIQLLMMGAATIAGVVGSDVIKEVWCRYEPFGTQSCSDLRKAAEQELFEDAPSLDAVSNQAGSDSKNVLANFEAEDWVCPSNNDGKPREYRGRIRVIELKDGKRNAEPWFNVVGKFNSQGFPTDVIIVPGDSDPSSINTKSNSSKYTNLVLHIVFDPSQKKPISYRWPDPTYDSKKDLLGSPNIILTPKQKLTPDQAARIDKAKDIVRYLNYRNYNCVVKKVEEQAQAGIDPGSPAISPTGASAIAH